MKSRRAKSGLLAVLVTGLCCGAAVARTDGTAVPEPAEVRKLLRAQTDYAALASDVRARTPRPVSGVPPLSKPEAEQ